MSLCIYMGSIRRIAFMKPAFLWYVFCEKSKSFMDILVAMMRVYPLKWMHKPAFPSTQLMLTRPQTITYTTIHDTSVISNSPLIQLDDIPAHYACQSCESDTKTYTYGARPNSEDLSLNTMNDEEASLLAYRPWSKQQVLWNEETGELKMSRHCHMCKKETEQKTRLAPTSCKDCSAVACLVIFFLVLVLGLIVGLSLRAATRHWQGGRACRVQVVARNGTVLYYHVCQE